MSYNIHFSLSFFSNSIWGIYSNSVSGKEHLLLIFKCWGCLECDCPLGTLKGHLLLLLCHKCCFHVWTTKAKSSLIWRLIVALPLCLKDRRNIVNQTLFEWIITKTISNQPSRFITCKKSRTILRDCKPNDFWEK